MQAQDIVTLLLPLLLVSILIEAVVLKISRRQHSSNALEALVNLSLGASNLIAGILFTGLHLTIYQYFNQKWMIDISWPHQGFQLLFAFLVYDFLYYWAHRAHHRCNILWANHLVHHSGQHFNLSTAVRLGFLGNFTVWIFFLPMAVLGISLEYYLLVISAQFIYQFFIHTTLIGKLGWLENVFVTPSQHRVHHASNSRYLDKNFGCFLVIWDRLFGSYQPELPQDPPFYGVTHEIAQPYSPGYLNCFLYASCFRQAFRQHSPIEILKTLLGPPSLLHPTSFYDKNERINDSLFVSCIRLLGPLIISFYIVLNATNLSTVDMWLLPLAFLLTNCLHSSLDNKPSGKSWMNVNFMCKAFELSIVINLYFKYTQWETLLWLAFFSCIASPAVDLLHLHSKRRVIRE